MATLTYSLRLALITCAILHNKGLCAAEPRNEADMDAVSVATEECTSNTEATSPEEGQALLQNRNTLERVKTGEWREGSVEQDMSSVNVVDAISDQSLNAELAQLTKVLPVQGLEAMVQTARDLRNQQMQPAKQPVKITDPEELPMLAPNPKTPEYELPESPDAEEETHILAKFIVVPISAAFFIIYNVQTIMEKFEITAIPETAVVIGYGVVLGFTMKTFAALGFFEDPEAWAKINTIILNFMLLPIIIFAGGWSLRRHDFASQLPWILAFAVVGTGVSTCVIAALMKFSGLCVMWRTAFVYASLISATDPVATLTTYSKLKVHPLLNIMVFGESTINDAVAIVLFRIFNNNELMGDPTKGEALPFGGKLIGNISWGIFKTFFGSVLFGAFLGIVYTLIARGADMRTNKKGQILVIFVSCYLTYAAAESFHLSGIIAETFCSLLMGIYMRPHLSKEGCVLTTFFVKQISTLADSAVFLVVGVSVVQLTPHGWKLGLWVSLFCLIARFVATYPIACIVNGLKAARGQLSGTGAEGLNLLEGRHIFMMWHGGLRGGIALALAWEMGAWVDIVEGRAGYRHALQTATFLVILFFLMIFGGSTSAFLNYFEIEMGQDYPEDYLSKTEDGGMGMTGVLKTIDTDILTPLLIGKEIQEQHSLSWLTAKEESKTAHIDAEHEVGHQVALKSFCTR